jgi:multiple sugar transport system substrate-binding protein
MKEGTNVSKELHQDGLSVEDDGRYTRRQVLRTAGAGALALGGLSALGGRLGLPDALAASRAGTVSFVYLGTAQQQQTWNKLFADFSKVSPQIALKATGIPVDNWAAFFDKVSTQLAGGVHWDIIQVATEGVQLFATRGLLEPLDPYLKQDKAVVAEYLNDVNPNLVKWNKQYGSPDGKTYYIPIGFNTMCMWINKDVFHKAGVDVPTDDWTWNDFRAAGKKIKSRTGAFLYPATAEYFIGVMPWLLTNGASTLSADWKRATCSSDRAIEAAEFARSLVVDKLSPPPGGTFDRFTLTAQGKMASFGGGRWPILNIRQLKAVNKMVILAWPHKRVHRGSPVGWGAYPILKAAQNKDDSWQFVKYLMSKHGTEYFAKLGGTIVPSRRSTANSRSFLDNSPPGTEKLYQALDYATPIPSPAKGNLVQAAIEDVWGQILAGNVTPEAGMKKMQSTIEPLL